MASITEVCEHVGISDRHFRDLRSQKIWPTPKGRAAYDLDGCRHAYIEYLRGRSRAPAPEGDDGNVRRQKNQDKLEEERARFAAEQADKYAMENAIRRREVVPVAVLQDYAEQLANFLRAGLESLPAMITRRIHHLRAAEQHAIKQEVAKLSDGLASYTFDHEGAA